MIENWILAAVGLFTMAGALFDWDWFMNNRRARIFVWMFGRDGARIFYVLLGIIIIVAAFFVDFADS